MDYLFDTIVYYSQLLVYHGLVVPYCARSSYRATLERNPPWLTQHPEVLRRHPPPGLAIWLSYSLALVLAVAYPLLQVSVEASLSILLMGSMFVSLLQTLIYYLGRIRRMDGRPDRRAGGSDSPDTASRST